MSKNSIFLHPDVLQTQSKPKRQHEQSNSSDHDYQSNAGTVTPMLILHAESRPNRVHKLNERQSQDNGDGDGKKMKLTKELTTKVGAMMQKYAATDPIHQKHSGNPSDLNMDQMYLVIDHDELDENEHSTIKTWNGGVEHSGLTMAKFDSALKAQPLILHLSFHAEGELDGAKPSVNIDRIPAMYKLLASNSGFKKGKTQRLYREYFMAIAILVEHEILSWIRSSHGRRNRQQSNWLRIDAESKIFGSKLMREFVQNIAVTRCGCDLLFQYHESRRYIYLYPGRFVGENENGQRMYGQPNHELLPQYYLSSVCNSESIEGIKNNIMSLYKKSKRKADKEEKKKTGKEVQCDGVFVWSLLNKAIEKKVPSEVWKWLKIQEKEDIQLNEDEVKEDEVTESMFGGEVYGVFDRTYILTVDPKHYDKEKDDYDEVVRGVMSFITEIMKRIKRDGDINGGIEFKSSGVDRSGQFSNVSIFRFKNAITAQMMKKQIIKPMREEYGQCTALFQPLTDSNPMAHRLCGYGRPYEERTIELDPENRSDAISKMIESRFVSKGECRTKLVVLTGCFSRHLAKLFEPFVDHIVCVHPQCPIDDGHCTLFGRFFYRQLALYKEEGFGEDTLKKAFLKAVSELRVRSALPRQKELVIPPDCMQDGAVPKQLRIVGLNRFESKQVRSALKSRNKMAAQHLITEPKKAPSTSFVVPRLSTLKEATSINGSKSRSSMTISRSLSMASLKRSSSPSLIKMSSTKTLDIDVICEDDEDDGDDGDQKLMEWTWYSSTTGPGYVILRCASDEQRDELKRDLLAIKKEDGAEWDVVDCCCDHDVPHREADKFMLISGGKVVMEHDEYQWAPPMEKMEKYRTEPIDLNDLRVKMGDGMLPLFNDSMRRQRSTMTPVSYTRLRRSTVSRQRSTMTPRGGNENAIDEALIAVN